MATFDDIAADLERQAIELPSWAFGNSGTRFKVFAQPGVPRDPFEKVADAAQVHAVHRPGAVGRAAHPVGPRRRLRQARAATPRTSASASARSTPTRSRTTTTCSAACATSTSGSGPRRSRHALECVDIMDVTGSRDLKVWLPDGLNYPGQADLRDRQERLADSLRAGLRPPRRRTSGWCSSTSSSSPPSTPPTCPTGAPPTCTASRSASGRWCASTPATTRRARTSSSSSCSCCGSGRLGAFDFNSRFYADDDLIVGAADPFQLFRILFEVVRGGGYDEGSERQLHARPVPQHRGEDPRARSARCSTCRR